MSLNLSIQGMSCTGCTNTITDTLSNSPGILQANVSLHTSSANILYDPQITSPSKITSIINDLGFSASPSSSLSLQNGPDTFFIVSSICGILTLFSMILPINQPIKTVFMVFVSSFLMTFVIPRLWNSLFKPLNMNTTIYLSSVLSYLLSVFLFLTAGSLSLFFESAVLVISFTSFGNYLQQKAFKKFDIMLSALSYTPPTTVNLLSNVDQGPVNTDDFLDMPTKEIPIKELLPNSIIRVDTDEIIPADCSIVLGESFVNESLLTGEPSPVLKTINDTVYASTTNVSHPLFLKVVSVGHNTFFHHLVDLANTASSSKPPLAVFTDFVSKWFVIVVLSLSFLTFLSWNLVGIFGTFTFPPGFSPFVFSVYTSLSVLVISCPCALGLAIPLAVVAACNLAFRRRILLKNGGKTLQLLNDVHHVVFDKTGTLTYGHPVIEQSFGSAVFPLVKAVCKLSTHPLCKCICSSVVDSSTNSFTVSNFNEILGKGITCNILVESHDDSSMIDSFSVKIGQHDWILSQSTLLPHVIQFVESSDSSVLVALDDNVVAGFSFSDAVRPTAKSIVSYLHSLNIQTWILTGDTPQSAAKIASAVGIPLDHVVSSVSPIEKGEFVTSLKNTTPSKSCWSWLKDFARSNPFKSYSPLPLYNTTTFDSVVAFVGDGKNDTIALAAADVGISFGTDTMFSNSSVVISSKNIKHLQFLFHLASNCVRLIKWNLFWVFAYNFLSFPIAAGIFYPHVTIDPFYAGLLMSFSSLVVVLSSLLFQFSYSRSF